MEVRFQEIFWNAKCFLIVLDQLALKFKMKCKHDFIKE